MATTDSAREAGSHVRRSPAQCPGCGSTAVLPGRVYCRPSCKAKHQWRSTTPRLPGLLDEAAVLRTELPPRRGDGDVS